MDHINPRKHCYAGAVALFTVFAVVGASFAAEAQTAETDEPAGVKVYTNKDLDRMFGEKPDPDAAAEPAADTTPPAAGATKPPGESRKPNEFAVDPLEQMKQRQAAEVQRRQIVAQAEADLAAAQAKLKNLEVQLLATRNPFSARPKLSDEEKEIRTTSGESAEKRNERTQGLVDEAREEVATAEEALNKAKYSGS
jgi:hypothetical protein